MRSRHQRRAIEVNHPRRGRLQTGQLLVPATRDDLPILNRDRLRPRQALIDRQHPTIHEQQIDHATLPPHRSQPSGASSFQNTRQHHSNERTFRFNHSGMRATIVDDPPRTFHALAKPRYNAAGP